ncbi:MAG: glycosyltransferase [Acidimicrobiales bacterium]
MSRVSVVIPNYRGGRLLREAVASVECQSLEDWELVIVSDGCLDDLSDLESDRRVHHIRQPRRGVSVARNVGIAHASADLVAFLDDDDRMLPERLLTQVGAMDDTEIGLCHSQFRLIDENGNVFGTGESKDSQYRDFLRGDGNILLSTTMARRAILCDVGGFNPLLPLAQDLDLLYRVARETRLRFLPEVLSEYRRHSSNTWLDTATGGEEYKSMLRQHLFIAEARGERDNVKAIRRGLALVPTGRASRHIREARQARADNRLPAMVTALAKAFLLSPRMTWAVVTRQARREIAARRHGTRTTSPGGVSA